MANYGVILVTVDTQEMAQEIAGVLVGDRLAACVNLFPIHSVYRWEGKIQQAGEWQLVIKTDLDLFEAIADSLQLLHPYDVPEIVALPFQQGNSPYIAWLADSVQTSTTPH